MTVYTFSRDVLCGYMRVFLGLRITGREGIPQTGPLIVCANHQHWIDPFIVAGSLRRQAFFLAKEELFKPGLGAWWFRALGAISVRRGEADRAALRRCLEILADGGVVGIFPEGTRSRDGKLGPGEPGAAVISLLSGADIMPMGIDGYRRGAPLTARWGTKLSPADFGGAAARRDKEAVQAYTAAIMAELARLSGREPRTVAGH